MSEKNKKVFINDVIKIVEKIERVYVEDYNDTPHVVDAVNGMRKDIINKLNALNVTENKLTSDNKEIKHGYNYTRHYNGPYGGGMPEYFCFCKEVFNNKNDLDTHIHQANLKETERIVKEVFETHYPIVSMLRLPLECVCKKSESNQEIDEHLEQVLLKALHKGKVE